MAVYTQIGAEEMAALVTEFDVGELVSAKGIAEGVSNSNWLLETTGRDGAGARYILTMYEFRIELNDLPYFLSLLDHLAARGCPVPRTIHDRAGALYRMRGDKAQLPAHLNTQARIHKALEHSLAGHDDFWPRWIVANRNAKAST